MKRDSLFMLSGRVRAALGRRRSRAGVLVDEDTVARLWAALEAQGKAAEVRALIDSTTRIRR